MSDKLSNSSKNNINNIDKRNTKTTLKHKKTFKKKAINNCTIFKTDINGRQTPKLYKSCVINQTCRKTKCLNIDPKIHAARFKIWGFDYNKTFFNATKHCNTGNKTPKAIKQCRNRAIDKIHKDSGIGELYHQLQECDRKTCNKERRIFITNLMRHKKLGHKKIKQIQNEDFKNDVDIDQIIEQPIKSIQN